MLCPVFFGGMNVTMWWTEWAESVQSEEVRRQQQKNPDQTTHIGQEFGSLGAEVALHQHPHDHCFCLARTAEAAADMPSKQMQSHEDGEWQ